MSKTFCSVFAYNGDNKVNATTPMAGIKNDKDFPLPVAAFPRRSFPLINGGNEAA